VIESPHSIAHEGFFEFNFRHDLFVLLVESYLLFEVIEDVLADVDCDMEVLPEVEVVLDYVEDHLLLWVFAVFQFQEVGEVTVVVVGIILVVCVVVSMVDVLHNAKLPLLLG
jgi:hypothetical protein